MPIEMTAFLCARKFDGYVRRNKQNATRTMNMTFLLTATSSFCFDILCLNAAHRVRKLRSRLPHSMHPHCRALCRRRARQTGAAGRRSSPGFPPRGRHGYRAA